jgi:act minimal PKS acyl carrier protein
MPEFTLDNLKRILREGAGTAENVDLDGDIVGVPFDQLGYDSLALLETIGRIEREYGIRMDDSAVTDAGTPGRLVDLVNTHISAIQAA